MTNTYETTFLLIQQNTYGFFVYRNVTGERPEYLHKDGTWHSTCGEPGYFPTFGEANRAYVQKMIASIVER